MNQNKSFWKDEVAFYLDGVSFVFKHVRRRKMSEGLLVTGKGSKELAGGKRLRIIVAITYGKGVVLKVPYENMNGNFFAEFIGKHFIVVLQSSDVENDRRLFLMDNDPSQTSKAVRKAMEKIEAEFHNIPARSLDLNSIENVFHLVKKSLYTISLPNRERN